MELAYYVLFGILHSSKVLVKHENWAKIAEFLDMKSL